MKILPTIVVLASLGFMVGCNRSDADRAASDATDTTVAATRSATETATNLSPTSRNTDGTTRTYQSDATKAATAEPDNTAKNVRDRAPEALTPGDQGNSESDIEITRKIRRALTQNDQLSTAAKNIKIITVNGKVTLRGPVASQQEQQAIAAAAQTVAGATPLDNQLEVKAQ
jgi:hyperosmotically inducible periplasmic protein